MLALTGKHALTCLSAQDDAHCLAFFQKFFRGESIVMHISFVMLIFILFSDQISGGKLPQGSAPFPCGRKPASSQAKNDRVAHFATV